MSSTIFQSLTTFFSGNGHHSPPHPTISPNQQFLSQNLAITPLNFTRVTFPRIINSWWGWEYFVYHSLKMPSRKFNGTAPCGLMRYHQITMHE
ncbi:hypothetical protein Hanom_Chr03g00274321 [Helianthus anomalus]